MSFVRPEIVQAAHRWREVIAGAVSVLFGLWCIVQAGGLMAWVGVVALLAGLALMRIGLQRGRFRGDGLAAGAVEVLEGQIAYFGPQTGGAVAVSELTRVILDRSAAGQCWRLEQPDAPPLSIPVDARGSDVLFDAFATLPGVRLERMLSELRRGAGPSVVIWERDTPRRLH